MVITENPHWKMTQRASENTLHVNSHISKPDELRSTSYMYNIYHYVIKNNVLSLYSVTSICIFRADHLGIGKPTGMLFSGKDYILKMQNIEYIHIYI